MIFDNVVNKINNGRMGLNKGIDMGHKRLFDYLNGVQRSTYYLIGGELGTGKSAFVDEAFVYNPYEFIASGVPDLDMHTIYFSLEIDKDRKITKAIAKRLYETYHVLVDINYILSKGKHRINEEIYRFVMEQKEHFYRMEQYVTIIDRPQNPTGIWKELVKFAAENGKWESNKELGDFTPSNYIPNNPNKYILFVIDHIGLMRLERGFNRKQNIDKLSEYAIILRNKCGFSPVLVQQLNRDMSSSGRFNINRVEPQLSDFKETGNTQEDADVVLALFSPARYDIKAFYGYNTMLLKNNFKSLHLLKNRDGEADKMLGMGFIGKTGSFFELPKSDEMTPEKYEKLIKLNQNYGQIHTSNG